MLKGGGISRMPERGPAVKDSHSGFGGGGGLNAFKPVLGGTKPWMQGDVGNKKDACKERK